ncbi:HD family phosphohydrolase [Egbenema bharatensis]|uniref:HD family phosphohydrolase n=1 Tax=Egbenema bharatensis TaxID=3463334 RepID=UPI003A887AAD
MNPFRVLTRQLAQWQRESYSGHSLQQSSLDRLVKRTVSHVKRCTNVVRTQALDFRPNGSRRKPRHLDRHSPIFFLIAVLSLTSTIGYRLYNEPQLSVGVTAPQTVRAPETATVIDTRTTEANRKAARTASIPILMIDQTVNQEIYHSLQRLLDRGNELRQEAGTFPFVETSVLSTRSQQYLRKAQESEWQQVLAAVEGNSSAYLNSGSTASNGDAAPAGDRGATRGQGSHASETAQQVAVLELRAYRRNASSEDFQALKDVINRARQRYALTVESLSGRGGGEASRLYNFALLELTDEQWAATRNEVQTTLQRILAQGVAPGLPEPILRSAIELQLRGDIPSITADLATQILLAVIRPNLIQDPEQTKVRAEQAAQAVEDVMVEIQQGEVIIRAGEPITQSDFVLLDYFGLSRRQTNWVGLLGFGALISGCVGVFLIVEHQFHPGLRRRDHILVLVLTLSVSGVAALGTPAIGLSALGLLVGSFYGSVLGVTVVGLLSLVLPVGMELVGTHLVASSVGGLIGATMAGRLRSREELAILGGVVGITQGVVYAVLSLMLSAASSPVWYIVLTGAALQSLLGVVWSIIALGVSPYLENLFDLITPVRLAELSNPNRPLLKRLASNAPGTFQHTLFVATLAEAAARELGCNVELVRAGTLYHDIGKMHDPLGFIENQMGGPNKHDLIGDPWLSAAIIKKHVTEGVVMARKCRLPKAIQAFIPEHQGTMMISYFHHQAQQRAKADPTIFVNDADFRYDGPIPQSRETGIVMLADSCEAALRSLKDATPEEALAMVNRILRARWQDEQLIDSGLTRAEMGGIAEIFVKVWQQFNHQRIPYPKAAIGAPAAESGS